MSGAEPFISTRIKMGETSNLRVVVQSGGKYFMAAREIKVTIGGCGDVDRRSIPDARTDSHARQARRRRRRRARADRASDGDRPAQGSADTESWCRCTSSRRSRPRSTASRCWRPSGAARSRATPICSSASRAPRQRRDRRIAWIDNHGETNSATANVPPPGLSLPAIWRAPLARPGARCRSLLCWLLAGTGARRRSVHAPSRTGSASSSSSRQRFPACPLRGLRLRCDDRQSGRARAVRADHGVSAVPRRHRSRARRSGTLRSRTARASRTAFPTAAAMSLGNYPYFDEQARPRPHLRDDAERRACEQTARPSSPTGSAIRWAY